MDRQLMLAMKDYAGGIALPLPFADIYGLTVRNEQTGILYDIRAGNVPVVSPGQNYTVIIQMFNSGDEGVLFGQLFDEDTGELLDRKERTTVSGGSWAYTWTGTAASSNVRIRAEVGRILPFPDTKVNQTVRFTVVNTAVPPPVAPTPKIAWEKILIIATIILSGVGTGMLGIAVAKRRRK